MLHLCSASRACALLGVTVAACVPSVDLEEIPGTVPGGSLLLVIVPKHAARTPVLYAANTSEPTADALTLPRSFTAYALIYSCGLEVLEIAAGTTRLDGSMEKKRALPGTRTIYEIAVVDDKSTGWALRESVPTELREIKIPGDPASKCVEFSATTAPLPRLGRGPGFALAIDPSTVVFSTEDGDFYRATDDRVVSRITNLSTTTPHLAAFRDTDGEIWLFGSEGTLAHGDFTRGFTSAPPMPDAPAYRIGWLAGSGAGETLELFTLTRASTFHRFSGATSQWTLLHDGAGSLNSGEGGVAVFGPSQAIAASRETDTMHGLVRYQQGVVDPVAPEAFRAGVFASAIAFIPGFGTVVGTNAGTLDVLRDGGWMSLGPAAGSPIQGFAPFGSGFVFARPGSSGDGLIQQYDVSAGLCAAQSVAIGQTLGTAPIADGILLISREGFDSTISFVRGMPAQSCEGLGTLDELVTGQ